MNSPKLLEIKRLSAMLAIIIGLFIISNYNYLLFHTVTVMFTIILASWIFIISWNARNETNSFLTIIGLTYLNVGIINLFYLLTNKSMVVFEGLHPDITSQFLITCKYLESTGILLAIFFRRNLIRFNLALTISITLSLVAISLILFSNIFTHLFTEVWNFTNFNTVSEFIFMAANLLSAYLVYRKKDQISNYLRHSLTISFILSLAASICFIPYNNAHNSLIISSHVLEMISFYFIYKALLVTVIRDPYNALLFHVRNNDLVIRHSRDELEIKVLERTKDLAILNKNLQIEIDERKKKEKELRKSEEQMSLLLKSSRIYISHFDKDLKPQPLFNKEIGSNTSKFSTGLLTLTRGWDVLEKIMKNVILNQKSFRDDVQFQLLKESVVFDIVVEPIFDENNQVSGVTVIAIDITDKKKIESVLKKKLKAIESIYTIATSFNYQKESIYEKICQSIALLLEVPVVSIGMVQNKQIHGHTKFINGKYEHSDDIINCAICKLMLSARTTCQISGDMQPLYPEESCIHVGDIKSFLGVPVFSRAGELTGVLCVLDNKERKFSEDQIQLLEIFARYISNEIEKDMFVKELVQSREMALLGQLTSGVAHEVRNPLNAIWAITEALFLDIDGDETNLMYKEHIHTQVQRLSRLMQDLLDLGKPRIRNDRFSLKSLCHETINLWTSNNAGRSHKITFCVDNDAKSFLVMGDSSKIQQVLINLIDNASEHSPEDTAILIRILHTETSSIILTISDSGKTIPQEILTRLFEPFFTTRKGGTGLGLSIVKHIVENHNGKVLIQNNTPPPGVTVTIILPASTDDSKCNPQDAISKSFTETFSS